MTTDAKRPLTMRDYKAKQTVKPAKPFTLRINLVFMVDGEPKGTIATEAQITPPATGEGSLVNWAVDARQFAQILAPLMIGPQAVAKQLLGPKIWTPRQD